MTLNAQLHDSLLQAQTYNDLGAAFFELDYPKYLDNATHYTRLSMRIASHFKDEKLVYSGLNLLGKVEEGKGNLDSALICLTQALEIVRRVSPVDEALSLVNLAGVYYNKREVTRAKKLALLAYKRAKNDNVNILVRMASALLSFPPVRT